WHNWSYWKPELAALVPGQLPMPHMHPLAVLPPAGSLNADAGSVGMEPSMSAAPTGKYHISAPRLKSSRGVGLYLKLVAIAAVSLAQLLLLWTLDLAGLAVIGVVLMRGVDDTGSPLPASRADEAFLEARNAQMEPYLMCINDPNCRGEASGPLLDKYER